MLCQERVLPELRALLALIPMLFATRIALMLIMHAMLMPSIAVVPGVSQGKVLPSTTLPRTHRLAPLQTPWRINPCEWCGALLLRSDTKTWCCKSGNMYLIPSRLSRITSTHCWNESQPGGMNEQSRQLNYLFYLSAIGVTEQWTKYQGLPRTLSILVPNAHAP